MKQLIMERLNSRFNQLEVKILDILESNCILLQEVQQLKDKNATLQLKQKEFINRNNLLEEENKRLKVANAVMGNQEYRRLTKLQLNKLIKEVDLCIAQIKSSR